MLYTHTHIFHSVTKLCPALSDLMNYSMPGFPILHYLSEIVSKINIYLLDAGNYKFLYKVIQVKMQMNCLANSICVCVYIHTYIYIYTHIYVCTLALKLNLWNFFSHYNPRRTQILTIMGYRKVNKWVFFGTTYFSYSKIS